MLRKANAVLSLFTPDRPELAVAEIGELLGRPRSTVYRMLATMATEGFLDQDPVTGRYRVGMRLAALGELARSSTSLQRVGHEVLLDLAEATGELASLMVPSGDEGVTVDVVESYHPLKIPAHLGGRFPLHATAGGRVMLAAQPEDAVDRVLSRPLARVTPATITSPVRLRRELGTVRRQGYAVVEGEWLADVNAVAAPVRDHRGELIAAIGAASPPTRWKSSHRRAMIKTVVTHAERLSRAMGHASSAGDRPARR
jgi:IclR family transcriptional regulator, KDG regulon repressor